MKKFLLKSLQKSVEEVYNPQYRVTISLYEPFQSGKHELLVDLRKLLHVTAKSEEVVLDKKTKKKLVDQIGIVFDAQFIFENYIVGDNNMLAFNAAKAVAENP